MVASCEGCHDAFKPDVPTEGITHQPTTTACITCLKGIDARWLRVRLS